MTDQQEPAPAPTMDVGVPAVRRLVLASIMLLFGDLLLEWLGRPVDSRQILFVFSNPLLGILRFQLLILNIAVFLLLLWRKTRAFGLGLAFATGLLVLLIALLRIPDAIEIQETWGLAASYFGLMAALQAWLAGAAMMAYWRLRPGQRSIPQLLWAVFVAVLFLGISPIDMTRMRKNTAGAAARIKYLNECLASHFKEHPEAGYPADFAPLAKQCPEELAGLGERSGYLFTYVPGSPDSTGRITRYSITARPVEYLVTGSLNFYSDETGVIRHTGANRSAAPSDPGEK